MATAVPKPTLEKGPAGTILNNSSCVKRGEVVIIFPLVSKLCVMWLDCFHNNNSNKTSSLLRTHSPLIGLAFVLHAHHNPQF